MRKRDVEISLLSIPLPDIEVEKVKSLLLLSKKVNKQQVYELSQCIQLMFNHLITLIIFMYHNNLPQAEATVSRTLCLSSQQEQSKVLLSLELLFRVHDIQKSKRYMCTAS